MKTTLKYLVLLLLAVSGLNAQTIYLGKFGGLFSTDGIIWTLMPTNTPTDGYALTAAGTAGYTKWAAVSGGSGNGAWRTNALTGVSQPNLSPYDLATAAIVIPQDAHFLASNGVSSRIFYPNGNAFAEFPLDSGFEFNEPGGQTAIKVASSAAGGYSLIDTNNNPVLNWENGIQISTADVTTLNVTTLKFLTNAGAVNPDFNKPYQKFGTNNNFTFLAPSNVELANKINVQSCVVLVTNVAKGSLMTVTPPANCWPQGNWFVTNNGVTTFTFFTYAGQWTNCVALPLF